LTLFLFRAAAQEPANHNTDQKHHKNQNRSRNKKSPEEKIDIYDRYILKYEKNGQRSEYQTDNLLVIQFFHTGLPAGYTALQKLVSFLFVLLTNNE
jgi:hypothetical protein